MNMLIALALLVLTPATASYSGDAWAWSVSSSSDEEPRNSYERQMETYRKHNYDTYENGPLPYAHGKTNLDRYNEALAAEEQERREQARRETAEQQRRESERNNGEVTCRSLYGC